MSGNQTGQDQTVDQPAHWELRRNRIGQVLDGLDVKTDIENTISVDAYTALRNIQHWACPTNGGKK